MMTYLNLILISPSMVMLINSKPYQKVLEILSILTTLNLQQKPLTCSLCMTVWTSLTYLMLTQSQNGMTILSIILMSLTNGFIADELDKKHQKLF